MKRLSDTKINLIITLLILLVLGLQVLSHMLSQSYLRQFNGILVATQFALCLLMLRIDRPKGALISITCLSLSIVSLAASLIIKKSLSPLTGLINTSIYLLAFILLNNQLITREKEAVTDFLTGLLNRRGISNHLESLTANKTPFHLLYVDLGNFKIINDNYGHTYGDMLLQSITDRMSKYIGKKGDLGRIGGAEFVVALNINENPEKLANELINCISLREGFTQMDAGDQIENYIKPFVGIASYPSDAIDSESVLKYADIAMYVASKSKTRYVCHFTKDMERTMLRQMEIEHLIMEGLSKNLFYLVYQPQYKLNGKALRGFEALLRLKTQDGQFVSPGEFIPVAEKNDLILQIDDYVIRRAMSDFKEIVLQSKEPFTISVNVSAKNIGTPSFPEKIKKALNESGFPASSFEIEITEYCLVQSLETTVENIKQLRSLGVQIALDDFGTGYTSLAYLAKLPINLLKVDKSLVDDIENNDKSRDFVQAVVSMGHLMGCEVISEGVESENQLSILKSQECDFVQGFVWGKPLDYQVAKELSLK